ncbi:MAG TPA: hypothetical protein VLH60_05600, partial [Sedimentisphaerales bacterium]|nr:hypothetical protein [Sedimentisphaerales bacterium]
MRKTSTCVMALFLGAVSVSAYSSVDAGAEHEFHDRLAAKGIEASFTVIGLYQRNVKGGLSTNDRKGEFTGIYVPELWLDLQKLLGIDGQFYIHGKGGWSDTKGIDAATVGSYGGINDIAIGNRTLDVVEAFYQ